MKKFYCLFCSLMMLLYACKKAYNPPLKVVAGGYLVVEGTINSGSDSTFIKLSRTVSLQSNTVTNPELNAIVTVESDQNTSYSLTETGNGNYACAGLNLDNTHKYRLDIKTTNNKQYVTDFMAVLNSPPIDSISYDVNGNLTGAGLNIYTNSHDATGAVKYYRWDYQETWEFRSAFLSAFKSNGDTVLQRDLVNDEIYTCYRSDTSSNIILASSDRLSQNILKNNLITFVPYNDEKLKIEYSILIRQYALTPDAYNFYVNIKKNTEQLGSIFDAEPSEISGNIHCLTTPSEPVIGYINIGNVASLRIFVYNRNLPAWQAATVYDNCTLFFDDMNNKPCCLYQTTTATGFPYNQVNAFINYDISGNPFPLIPIDALRNNGGLILGYSAATKECTDCTLRGTNVRPAFWQ